MPTNESTIRILGTSHAFSGAGFGPSAALVRNGNNYLLLDCGPHSLNQLLNIDPNLPSRIHQVYISHAHEDHLGGLCALIFYRYYKCNGMKTEIICSSHVFPKVRNYLQATIDRMVVFNNGNKTISWGDVVSIKHSNKEIISDVGKIEFINVDHVPGVFATGVIISVNGGKRIFWSGDMKFKKNLIEKLSKRCSKLFVDCALYPYFKGTVHCHLNQLKSLPVNIQKKTVLIHHGLCHIHEYVNVGNLTIGFQDDVFLLGQFSAMKKLISVGVIVTDGKFFLICHPSGAGKRWDIPKGLMENTDKDPRRTAIRELCEETGIIEYEDNLKDLGVVPYNKTKDLHLFALYVSFNEIDCSKCFCSSTFNDKRGNRIPEMDDFLIVPREELKNYLTENMMGSIDAVNI